LSRFQAFVPITTIATEINVTRDRDPLLVAMVFVLMLFGGLLPANALTKVHVGKATAVAWPFIPLDVGVDEGIFAKYGLDIDITDFGGDAKLQQGLASGSVDFGLGSGPAMAFVAKGAPDIAVASFAGGPPTISIIVGANAPIKTVADLKGKLLGVTTAGAMTTWLVHQVSIKEGWGLDGIRIAALGGFEPESAALITGQIDGMMAATEAGYTLEERHNGRILVGMESYAPLFVSQVVYARKDLVDKDLALVTRFLKGFFGSIAFVKSHKKETDDVAESVLRESPMVASKTYDREISVLNVDGSFDPQGLAVLKQSFVDTGTLQAAPRDDQLFTTQFLPVKP
jgi:ABC-type nitrate/sulfonate/bicarbonate transport system substrate-binding protein